MKFFTSEGVLFMTISVFFLSLAIYFSGSETNAIAMNIGTNIDDVLAQQPGIVRSKLHFKFLAVNRKDYLFDLLIYNLFSKMLFYAHFEFNNKVKFFLAVRHE